MQEQHFSLTTISDFLSLPWQRLMDHALKNRLTESPWLLLHSLLCRIVAYALAKNLPEKLVNIDVLLSLGLVSHSTRVIADEGLKGVHINPNINQYMKTHSTLDFAYQDGIIESFPWEIQEWILHFINNPRTRVGYFPHETIVNRKGEINWTEALYQISSWSIAGGITTLDKRFDDLRNRRSEEIWKLELDYIKEKIWTWENYRIPEPILNAAAQSLWYMVTSESLKSLIQGNIWVDNKKMWEWILNSYQVWANSVRKKYCELIWVADFDIFLRQQIDTVKDSHVHEKIKNSFEWAIWRKLRDDEFFPTIPGMDLIYKRIWAMKVESTQESAKNESSELWQV